MNRYRQQVAAALGAVTIRGPTQYSWLGRSSRPLPERVDTDLDEPDRRRYLVSCLREELYMSFYCHGRPVPARWGEPQPVFAAPWLGAALSQANTGRGSWEPGWTVQRLQGGEAVVARARLRARAPVGDCIAPYGAVRPGAAVGVRLPKELPALSPGYHTVVSDTPTDHPPSESVVRVYWNVACPGAPALVGALTSRLNAEEVPFRLKVADHPFRFERCDAAVLYLEGNAFLALRQALRDVAAALSAHLGLRIPAFTLELAPGVGLAEGNEDGESFGLRRCAVLADGIVGAYAQRITQPAAQLDAVAARFSEVGVPIEAPFLEPSLTGRHVL